MSDLGGILPLLDVCRSTASAFEGAGELVFPDITASNEGRKTVVEVARRTSSAGFIPDRNQSASE